MTFTQQIKALEKQKPAYTLGILIWDWLAIFGLLFLAIHVPHGFIWIFVFVVIARQQHALLILFHDAAHGRLFKNRKTNEWVGEWFTGSPLFFSLKSYRHFHFAHHKAPLTETDPDLSVNGNYPISKMSGARKILRDLFFLTFFKFYRYFSFETNPDYKKRPLLLRPHVLRGYLINGILLGFFWFQGHPFYYLFFWIFPYMTVLMSMFRIRSVVEHAAFKMSSDQSQCTRTLLSRPYQWIIAPHNVNYHIEHHLYPKIPWYALPQVHRLLKQENKLAMNNVHGSFLKATQDFFV